MAQDYMTIGMLKKLIELGLLGDEDAPLVIATSDGDEYVKRVITARLWDGKMGVVFTDEERE